MSILIILTVLAVLIAAWYMGGREFIGDQVAGLFPKSYAQVGDKVNVFMNGSYNRTATITSIHPDKLTIYDTVALQVDYRGSFYAVGVAEDGCKLVYITNPKLYRYVKLAELARKMFAILDDTANLVADDVPTVKQFDETEESDEE